MDEKRGAVSMHRTIDFPNLGIHLKSVGDHITVFGFDIAYYGFFGQEQTYWFKILRHVE